MGVVIRFIPIYGNIRAVSLTAGMLLLLSPSFLHSSNIENQLGLYRVQQSSPPSPDGTAGKPQTNRGLQTISFRDAGISLKVPIQWEFHPPDMIHGPLYSLSVSPESKKQEASLSDFVGRVNAYREKMARTVKQNQYYTLVLQAEFQTHHGDKAIKCVYGYSAEAPSGISYFLLKSPLQVVTLNLKFHTWDTGNIWTGTDKTIMNGIRCRQREELTK